MPKKNKSPQASPLFTITVVQPTIVAPSYAGHRNVIRRVSGRLNLEGLERAHYFEVDIPFKRANFIPYDQLTEEDIRRWIEPLIPDLDIRKQEMLDELQESQT